MQKSKIANQSFLNVNNSYIQDYIARLDESASKDDYNNSISRIDQQLYSYYAAQNYTTNAVSKQLYCMPGKSSIKLQIPKNNSLTDSMLRTTLGCDQKLAQSYVKIIDQTQKIENQQKNKRIEQARKKFASSNCHRDFLANSKAFSNKSKYYVDRPVLQTQYDSYLKTQLTLMHDPASINSNKEFLDKFTGSIARKINEIGGIEDTLEPMSNTLGLHEINNTKSRQGLSKSKQKKPLKLPIHTTNSGFFKTDENSWINRSKLMRQQMMSSFNS